MRLYNYEEYLQEHVTLAVCPAGQPSILPHPLSWHLPSCLSFPVQLTVLNQVNLVSVEDCVIVASVLSADE